jgi:[ribosomal protein S18]-alanine N-acetyltransferase
MSAQVDNLPHIRVMSVTDLDAVMAVENIVYTHPWTRGNFSDSIAAGSHCWVMEIGGELAGYAVTTSGAGETHLLNLSVAINWQRRGLGRELLMFVGSRARALKSERIFLEVRVSNIAAHKLYVGMGFREIGLRRDYYPAHPGREDARVLELVL